MICKHFKEEQRNLVWKSLVFITFIGSGLLIYVSILYSNYKCTSGKVCSRHTTSYAAKRTDEDCRQICTSKECVLSADMILNNMNQSVDPCEDFYSFTCGNFAAKFHNDEDQSIIDRMQNSLKLELKDILDRATPKPRSASDKLKKFYDSCMNESSSEMKAVPTVLKFLERNGFGTWPNLYSNFSFPESNLADSLGKFVVYNEFFFFRFSYLGGPYGDLSPDAEHFKGTLVAEDLPVLSDESREKIFHQTVIRILNYLDVDKENINRIWLEFKSIDSVILKLYVEGRDDAEKCGTEQGKSDMFLDCSQGQSENLQFICNVSNSIIENGKLGPHYSKDLVYIPCRFTYFVRNIFPHVSNMSHRSLADYMAVRFIIYHLDFMNLYLRSVAQDQHSHEQEHRDTELGKFERCIKWVSTYMLYALASEYASKKLSTNSLHEISEIVYEIRQYASDEIIQQEWVQENEKADLKNLVDSIINQLDYNVAFLKNASLVNTIYKKFTPTKDSFLWNILKFQKFYFISHMLKEQYPELDERTFSATAEHSSGIVDLKFGILLPPVYQYGRPRLLNIATLGTCVGHEIGHEISNFLSNDNKNRETEIRYHEKKACFVEKYSQFKFRKTGKKVMGNRTFNENVADIIGLYLVEKIFKTYLAQKNEEVEFYLPGLEYSPQQMMYIAAAQLWCEVQSKGKEELHYERDPHAPTYVRMIGMVQNSQEFSKIFKCPQRSPMNPVHKCSLFE